MCGCKTHYVFRLQCVNLRIAWQHKKKVIKSFSNFLIHHEHNNQTELKFEQQQLKH